MDVGMSRADYVTTILAEYIDESLDFICNLLRRPFAQNLLEVNTAIETKVFAKILLEPIRIHARSTNLYGL